MQMMNSKIDNNGPGSTGAALLTYHKQSSVAIKKIALRDVQNENRSYLCNYAENSRVLEERPTSDSIKVSGTKRIVPECPSSPPCPRPLSNNTSRKFEAEVSKQIVQGNSDKNCNSFQTAQFWHKKPEMPQQKMQIKGHDISCFPAFAPMPISSAMTFSSVSPSVTNSRGKPFNQMSTAEASHYKATFEAPHVLHIHESRQNEYIQKLLQMSPAELSRHAVELETRSMRLTFEEGREMERMKALNIKLLPVAQHVSPKKY